MNRGHFVLEQAIDSIEVGFRHRQDLGDLDELCESIQRVGLLHPIVISADNILIIGGRRLAAHKRLGRNRVPVWVKPGVSDRLGRLLAIQDANSQRKDLSPTEAAGLYAELKAILTEDAARRQAATRFGANLAYEMGGGDSPPPRGEAREQAARAITGHNSYHRHEQVLEILSLVTDRTVPDWLRRQAQEALEEMDLRGRVSGPYTTVKAAEATARLAAVARDSRQPTANRRLAQEGLHVLRSSVDSQGALRMAVTTVSHLESGQWPVSAARAGTDETSFAHQDFVHRRFLTALRHLPPWEDLDPAILGGTLTDSEWKQLRDYERTIVEFVRDIRFARDRP